MKGNKSQFSSKLSAILTKFKDSSTVQVGHEQVKNMFGQFALKDIFIAFISKMDNIEQMNDRQKREISKIYITFAEVYKADILIEQYYEKFMESISKKSIGVSEVIGHICKTLLNRIQDHDQLLPFVITIINIFHNHIEIAKILKQTAQTINPNIISSLQHEIISVLQEKIGAAKSKSEYLDAVLSLVLCLEQKLQVQNNVIGLLLKYLRSDDWSCRKNCIDICYALLVINQTINGNIHAIVKQLKYDKIKHVRDSVNNYQKLHEQIFGKEGPKSPIPSIREAKIKSQISIKKINKSPLPQPKQTQFQPQKSISLDKSSKPKLKNQNFFKNAKNSDVIKTNEEKEEAKIQEEEININLATAPLTIKQANFNKDFKEGKNFEAYLKNRISPQKQAIPLFEKKQIAKESEVKKALAKFDTLKSQNKGNKQEERKKESKGSSKFNYESEFQHFKKKSRAEASNQQSQEYMSFGDVEAIEKSLPQFSQSYISTQKEINYFQEFKNMLLGFEKRVSQRLDKMEYRIDNLQRSRLNEGTNRVNNDSNRLISLDTNKPSKAFIEMSQQESPRSILFSEAPNESKYSYSEREGIESNLEQKIRISINSENWDEAYTIALTNNKKNILLNLLERCAFPTDPTVEQCIMLEVRKLLGYMSTLKWLKYYLMEKPQSKERLQKLRDDLAKRPTTDNRNYEMMKQILLNEIEQQMSGTIFK